jgi:hypothetical protein
MSAVNPPDDLETVRIISQALEPFSEIDRDRIIRWVREKLGMDAEPAPGVVQTPGSKGPGTEIETEPHAGTPRHKLDLKSFIDQKQPASDVQFATAVAYYYAFEAPGGDRRDTIGAEDLQEACRLSQRQRLVGPAQTLRNAVSRGYLDRAERGQYSVNTVGENLVAMTLPGGSQQVGVSPPRRRGTGAKKAASKPPAKRRTGKATGTKKKALSRRVGSKRPAVKAAAAKKAPRKR